MYPKSRQFLTMWTIIILEIFLESFIIIQGAQPPNSISITNFGATANDGTDDTVAIKRAISAAGAASSKNRTIYIPAGTFRYSSVLPLASLRMIGEGDSSILLGTDPNNTAINLSGNGPSLENLKIVSLFGPQEKRTAKLTAVGILVGTYEATLTKDFFIKSVTVVNGSSAGIFSLFSGPGKILSTKVDSTLADCIHLTHETHDVIVADNLVTNCGDDMFATVAYKSGGNPPRALNPVRNILIQNNTGITGIGRGLTAIGSAGISFLKNKISNTKFAGILIASEKGYNTQAPRNILVQENQLKNVASEGGHGGLFLAANFGPSDRVTLVNNFVSGTKFDGILVSGVTRNTTIVGNRLENIGRFSVRFINSVDSIEIYVADNWRDGKKVQPARATGATLRHG